MLGSSTAVVLRSSKGFYWLLWYRTSSQKNSLYIGTSVR